MDVKATLLPGVNGTKSLLKEYGDQLVCVRYRYDELKQKRYKTAEIIVEEKHWHPGVTSYPDKRVFIRIGYRENTLRDLVKQHGGYGNPDKKAWHLTYRKVVEPGLEKRPIDKEIPF